MNPLNYEDLQQSSIEMQRKVYGWAFEIGPLLIHPDVHDKTRRRIINYYWKRHYILTSAQRFIVVNLYEHRIVCSWFMGRMVIKDVFHAAA